MELMMYDHNLHKSSLGPKELIEFNRLDPHLPHNGLKAPGPDGSTEQDIKLSHLQARQRELLSEQRVARFGNLSIGDWNQDLQLIEVKSGKGKFWHTMGYNAGTKKYLYPEEGLYLLELNSLELLYQGVPLSLQQAYELLIPTEFTLEDYQAYAHLMRLGYIVSRHKQNDITEYEQRIKLYHHRNNRWQRACKKVEVWFDKMSDRINDIPNSSDSGGDATEESYYSSSSGNGISLYSAGDLDAKMKTSRQERKDMQEAAERTVEMDVTKTGDEDGDGYSSEYSDGPISELSTSLLPPERVDSDFDYSLVDLLDYHKRHCRQEVSSSELGGNVNKKVMKRRNNTPWYMTSLNSMEGSSRESVTWGPWGMHADKIPWQALKDPIQEKLLRESIRGQKLSSPRVLVDRADSLEKRTKAESSDAVATGNPSSIKRGLELADEMVDIDEFLQTVVKKRRKKRKLKKCKNQPGRPHSQWNFTRIRMPDMSPGHQELSILSAQMLSDTLKPICSDRGQQDEDPETPPAPGISLDMSLEASPEVSPEQQENRDSVELADSGLDSGSKQNTLGEVRGESRSLQKPEGGPRNWKEYKSLLKSPEKDLRELLVSPVNHLWQGAVHPLVMPSDAVSPDSLMRKLQVIQSIDTKDFPRYCESASKDVVITFDVHLPTSSFKKTSPGRPAFHAVIFSVQDPVPQLPVQMSLLHQSGMVPLVFAIVDNADLTFCCLTDAKAMTTIS